VLFHGVRKALFHACPESVLFHVFQKGPLPRLFA